MGDLRVSCRCGDPKRNAAGDMIAGLEPTMIVQENHYDPWGVGFADATSSQTPVKNTDRFQYNGQEKISDLGIGLYDYGARHYDPTNGRFISVDPLAEISRRYSTYAYVFNNPMNLTDPDGMSPTSQIYGLKEGFDYDTEYDNGDGQEDDEKKNKKNGGKTNTVAIVAYKEKHKDAGAFEQRKKGFKAQQEYTVHDGKALIAALIEASKKGPITKLIVGSHGSGKALYMNPNAGIYNDSWDKNTQAWWDWGTPKEGSATLGDLESHIQNGDIKFADDAQVFFVGCNTANYSAPNPWADSFAENFSELFPNIYVTGSTAHSSPLPEKTKSGRVIDSNNYSAEGNAPWKTFKNGQLIKTKKGSINPNE